MRGGGARGSGGGAAEAFRTTNHRLTRPDSLTRPWLCLTPPCPSFMQHVHSSQQQLVCCLGPRPFDFAVFAAANARGCMPAAGVALLFTDGRHCWIVPTCTHLLHAAYCYAALHRRWASAHLRRRPDLAWLTGCCWHAVRAHDRACTLIFMLTALAQPTPARCCMHARARGACIPLWAPSVSEV